MKTFEITGIDKLVRTMDNIRDRSVMKVVRATISAGLTPMAKAIRRSVFYANASERLKKSAKVSVGSSLRKSRTGMRNYEAKAGFGVGRRTKAYKEKIRRRSKEGRGVGISKQNIHWFVLGTKERKKKTTGTSTGEVDDKFSGLIESSVTSVIPQMMRAMRDAKSRTMEREAKRIVGRLR